MYVTCKSVLTFKIGGRFILPTHIHIYSDSALEAIGHWNAATDFPTWESQPGFEPEPWGERCVLP